MHQLPNFKGKNIFNPGWWENSGQRAKQANPAYLVQVAYIILKY